MSEPKINITRTQLIKVLQENNWSKLATASDLGIGEASVRRACRRLKIDTELEKKSAIGESNPEFYSTLKRGSNKKANIDRFVIIPDLHADTVMWDYLAAVCKFVKDFAPGRLIQLGDLMDYGCLLGIFKKKYPSFDAHDIGSLDKEFQAVAKIISMLNSAAPKKCQKYFLKGNHEYRADFLIKKSPEFDSMFNIEKRVDMSGWKVLPYLDKLKLGKLNVIHGVYFGANSVRKHLQNFQKNVVFGHTHMIAQATWPSPMREIPIWGATIGCICDLNAEYMRNQPSSAEHGFAYGWFEEKSGDFDCRVVRIIHGKFWAEGKRYE